MEDFEHNWLEEKAYLARTVEFIRSELDLGSKALADKKRKLIASRKDMWENTVPASRDFARIVEVNQYRTELNTQTATYINSLKKLEKYKRMLDAPYFGRFDFVEEGSTDREKIYIGLGGVVDPETLTTYVFDWRAPISSIFYRYELGKASYSAPVGTITGEVLLKRQYKIKKGNLKYFFDCSVTINDEMLQEALSGNASAQMKNIVETIQKEQDIIIRDTENDLLIVQGVAGSGKTSIALHRIAFLLYEGLNKLRSNNILIVSPNSVFSKYISGVLPELGEENVKQATFDDIIAEAFGGRFRSETRDMQLESLVNSRDNEELRLRRQSIDFKGSAVFKQILDRLLWHYTHRLIPFEDVYYNGKIIMTRQQLKARLLRNQAGLPIAKQLSRLENIILDRIHALQPRRIAKLQKIVEKSEGHDFEVKSFSRLLSMKETKRIRNRMHRFTRIDYWRLYQMLFDQWKLFSRLSYKLDLPQEIEQIVSDTARNLKRGWVSHEDCAPLLYLMLRIEGSDLFKNIRQVVIDEAQDYSPLQYEVFKLLFTDAKYTLLGDMNQTIEKEVADSLYDDIAKILNKQKTILLHLNKSYRSSYEINSFTQKVLGGKSNLISFERHEPEPVVERKSSIESLDQAVIRDIQGYLDKGYDSLAVICKTQEEARAVHGRLKTMARIGLIEPRSGRVEKGAVVMASYMSKGLEFDVVIVYGADDKHYSSEYDRRLLYVACTRALHRLVIYYTGEKSPFIPVPSEQSLPAGESRTFT